MHIGPIAGLMADRIGHRPTIMIGCIGSGLSSAAASITYSFELIFLFYGLLMGKYRYILMFMKLLPLLLLS